MGECDRGGDPDGELTLGVERLQAPSLDPLVAAIEGDGKSRSSGERVKYTTFARDPPICDIINEGVRSATVSVGNLHPRRCMKSVQCNSGGKSLDCRGSSMNR